MSTLKKLNDALRRRDLNSNHLPFATSARQDEALPGRDRKKGAARRERQRKLTIYQKKERENDGF